MERVLQITAFPHRLSGSNTPYQTLLYGRLWSMGTRVRGYNRIFGDIFPSDILHVHWPDRVLGGAGKKNHQIARWQLDRFLGTLKRYSNEGKVVVWTVHNLRPHDFPTPKTASLYDDLERRFIEMVGAVIYLSHHSRRATEGTFPALARRPSAVIPHMIMADGAAEVPSIPSELPIADCSGRRFVALGLIRPYKNLERAIAIFEDVATERDVLVIAGQPTDASYLAHLGSIVADKPNVKLLPRGLSNAEFAGLLDWADYVFALNAGDGNSGALMSALGSSKRVISSDGPVVREIAERVGPGWIHVDDPEGTLPRNFGEIRSDRANLEWASLDTVAAAHWSFFREIAACRG